MNAFHESVAGSFRVEETEVVCELINLVFVGQLMETGQQCVHLGTDSFVGNCHGAVIVLGGARVLCFCAVFSFLPNLFVICFLLFRIFKEDQRHTVLEVHKVFVEATLVLVLPDACALT